MRPPFKSYLMRNGLKKSHQPNIGLVQAGCGNGLAQSPLCQCRSGKKGAAAHFSPGSGFCSTSGVFLFVWDNAGVGVHSAPGAAFRCVERLLCLLGLFCDVSDFPHITSLLSCLSGSSICNYKQNDSEKKTNQAVEHQESYNKYSYPNRCAPIRR